MEIRVVLARGISKFNDPYAFQAAVKPAQLEILVTAKGNFDAGLTQIELPRLRAQRGRENLPRVANSTVPADRPLFFFLAGPEQRPIRHCGRELEFGEIVVAGPNSTHHHQTEASCRWATLSLTRDNLADASIGLVGRNLAPSASHRLRPAPALMSWLLIVHQAAEKLATQTTDILAQSEPGRALEHELLHAMVMCLSEGGPTQMSWSAVRHTAIIGRFEELLEEKSDRPLHLLEICTSIGVSERTLRVSCMEHLGMGPVRYLWLRRMHLARRALLLANGADQTVTKIATKSGFWELGRFAVEYGALFEETPSATLRQPAQQMRNSNGNPFAFADSEYTKSSKSNH